MEDISKVDTKRENNKEDRRNVINRQEKQKHSNCGETDLFAGE